MSKKSNKNQKERLEEEDELESQFIIQFPEDKAETVREAIENGTIDKILAIRMDDNMRSGKVWLNGESMKAELFDLPNLVESYKTLDRVDFYKTADVSQMLVVGEDPPKDPKEKKKKAHPQTDEVSEGAGVAGIPPQKKTGEHGDMQPPSK